MSPGLPPVIDHAAQRPAGIWLKIPRVLERGVAQLTCRANQGHIDIIGKNYKPAPGKPEWAFSFCAARFAELVSILRIWFAEFFVKI
jgi:hypothetical protein